MNDLLNQFTRVIDNALIQIPENQGLANDFISHNTSYLYYVIGKNEDSQKIIRKFSIVGVIDDFAELNTEWNNVRVVKSSEIPQNGVVINCSTSISPLKVIKILNKAGVKNILNLNEIVFASKGIITPPLFVEEMRSDFRLNFLKWFEIYQRFEDKESREIFLNIICYRLTGDLKYMMGNTVRLKEQYFEEFMNYNSEIFVDIGGFDGDTTEEFCNRFPDYKKILFFEPSLENMIAAKKRLSKYDKIEYYEYGLSDKTEKLMFSQNDGSASSINNNGNVSIQVTTLDDKITEPISVIKMDIEGWELKALCGCSNHIRNNKPKLALAVYHKASDFHEIPNYVFSVNPNYKLYLRHYTEGWSESVMFFVPK
jgi:FkbM family methyltransferase